MNGPHESAAESFPTGVSLAEAERLTGVGVFRWWPARNEVQWSENLFRLFGLEPGLTSASTEWWLAHVHPADRVRLAEDRERVELGSMLPAEGEVHPPLDYRMVLEDGQVIHLRTAIVAVGQDVDGARYVTGLVVDVTEQAHARREARVYEAVAAALVEWGAFEASAERLLACLAKALEFDLGVLWRPHGDVLIPHAVWHSPLIADDVASTIRNLRPGPGGDSEPRVAIPRASRRREHPR